MTSISIDKIIDGIIQIEGGYTNDEADHGGATNFGITESVARANGYHGDMKDMPVQIARDIYFKRYWIEPKLDQINVLSSSTAEELCDTGVNCGTGFAKKSLQQALNLLNQQEKDYKDLVEDGDIGPATLSALAAFLMKRGKEGEAVLVKVLNIVQGSRYIEIVKNDPTQEKYFFGWIKNRVVI